jgi:hypothetical protein
VQEEAHSSIVLLMPFLSSQLSFLPYPTCSAHRHRHDYLTLVAFEDESVMYGQAWKMSKLHVLAKARPALLRNEQDGLGRRFQMLVLPFRASE